MLLPSDAWVGAALRLVSDSKKITNAAIGQRRIASPVKPEGHGCKRSPRAATGRQGHRNGSRAERHCERRIERAPMRVAVVEDREVQERKRGCGDGPRKQSPVRAPAAPCPDHLAVEDDGQRRRALPGVQRTGQRTEESGQPLTLVVTARCRMTQRTAARIPARSCRNVYPHDQNPSDVSNVMALHCSRAPGSCWRRWSARTAPGPTKTGQGRARCGAPMFRPTCDERARSPRRRRRRRRSASTPSSTIHEQCQSDNHRRKRSAVGRSRPGSDGSERGSR